MGRAHGFARMYVYALVGTSGPVLARQGMQRKARSCWIGWVAVLPCKGNFGFSQKPLRRTLSSPEGTSIQDCNDTERRKGRFSVGTENGHEMNSPKRSARVSAQ